MVRFLTRLNSKLSYVLWAIIKISFLYYSCSNSWYSYNGHVMNHNLCFILNVKPFLNVKKKLLQQWCIKMGNGITEKTATLIEGFYFVFILRQCLNDLSLKCLKCLLIRNLNPELIVYSIFSKKSVKL